MYSTILSTTHVHVISLCKQIFFIKCYFHLIQFDDVYGIDWDGPIPLSDAEEHVIVDDISFE